MDRWDEQTYRRVLVLDGTPVAVAVRHVGTADAPRLEVATIGGPPAPALRSTMAAALDRLLGLHQDMTAFDAFACADDLLRPLVSRFRGFKPPRFPSVFECLANAIACQQITLTLGIRVLNRLTEAYGLALDTPGGTAYAFPRPQELAAVDPDALRRLGFSNQKARSLIELAGAVASGRLDLEGLAMLDDAAVLARLLPLRGVGRWTAEYARFADWGASTSFPATTLAPATTCSVGSHWRRRSITMAYIASSARGIGSAASCTSRCCSTALRRKASCRDPLPAR